VVHDQGVEIPGISQRPPHHLRIGDAPVAIGESHRARGFQQPDLGHLLAAHALGQCRHRIDIDDGGFAAGTAQARNRPSPNCRMTGEVSGWQTMVVIAAGRSPPGWRKQRFRGGWRQARRQGTHVDQAGCDDLAGAIDDVGCLRARRRRRCHAGSRGSCRRRSDVADAVEIARGIDQAGVGDAGSGGDRLTSFYAFGRVAGERLKQPPSARHSHFQPAPGSAIARRPPRSSRSRRRGSSARDASPARRAWHRPASSGRGRNSGNIPGSKARTSRFMRSRCSRSIMTMSAPFKPSRISRATSTPIRSIPRGSSVEGATTRTRAPIILSKRILERATRECHPHRRRSRR